MPLRMQNNKTRFICEIKENLIKIHQLQSRF
ncbi:hypothetical protein NC652_040942 [Populus alba x Populus x berolinensis]|nr:hypothetical protein NC652_040942 [Populus alba x Populus x berolinensis]